MDGWGATGDAVTRAVLLLALVLLARTLLTAALAGLAATTSRAGRFARAVACALRPGLVRRLTVLLVGLGAPIASAAQAAPASALAASGQAVSAAPAEGRPTVVVGPVPVPRPPSSTAVYVVRPGDSLWDIARRHLPPTATGKDVARAWPRWYAANRAAIGPDPSLLRPGTRLRAPGPHPAGTPARAHHSSPATPDDAVAVAQSLDPDRR